MTTLRKCGYVLILSIISLLLSVNFTLSSGAPAEEENTASDEDGGPFPITSPAARNPLPTDILDQMRKELMVLMGVSLESTEKTGSDKSQSKGQH